MLLICILMVLLFYLTFYSSLYLYIGLLEIRSEFRSWGLRKLPYDICFFLFDMCFVKRWFYFFSMCVVFIVLFSTEMQIIWCVALNPFVFLLIQMLLITIQLFFSQINLLRVVLNFIFGSLTLYICWSVLLVKLSIIEVADLGLLHIVNPKSTCLYNRDIYTLMYNYYNDRFLYYFVYNIFGSSKVMQVSLYIFLYFLIEFSFVGLLSIFITVYKGLKVNKFKNLKIYIFSFMGLYCTLLRNSLVLSKIFNLFSLYVLFLFSIQFFILYLF